MKIDESYRLSELTIPWDWGATCVCCSMLQCVAVCCQSSPMSAYEWVMAHKRWSHVTYLNSPFRVTELPHMCVAVCLQRVAVCCRVLQSSPMNESRHTYEWVMAHTRTSHVTELNSPFCETELRHVCVAVCCSVLQCVAVCCSVLQTHRSVRLSFDMCVLQCVAVCCTLLQTHRSVRLSTVIAPCSAGHTCVCVCVSVFVCIFIYIIHYMYTHIHIQRD